MVADQTAQSRIFQQKTVKDILKEALEGLKISIELSGDYKPRDFCVQYRETDFNFVSRLMEEEGIFYYFKHTDGNHEMVLGDVPGNHAELSPAKIVFRHNSPQADQDGQDFIYDWNKTQEVTSGKYTLWDHSFELPHKHLESQESIGATVAVGQATHKLQVADNAKLELYDWPGEYDHARGRELLELPGGSRIRGPLGDEGAPRLLPVRGVAALPL